MAAPTAGLVPITRSFLAKFYDKHPLDPQSEELKPLQERLIAATDALEGERKKIEGQSETFLEEILLPEPPHKLDENFWKNREQIEEIMFLLESNNWPAALKGKEAEDGGTAEALPPSQQAVVDAIAKWNTELAKLLDVVATYQNNTSNKVSDMVFTYMPQDFRGTLMKQQKERSEKRRQAEVDALVAAGGSIKQKYALLWQQQMDRRKTLAALGAATGIFRTLVTYLGGVPQVLLDFVKTINDHNGPMEEQRLRYGPALYDLTAFVNRLRVFIAVWWTTFDSPTATAASSEYIGLVSDSLRVYGEEISKFLKTLQEIFENSPFLISAEEAMSAEDKAKAAEDFKEVTVQYGQSLTVPVAVEDVGAVVAWDFKLTAGKDIGFSVDYIPSEGNKTGVYPYSRIESHEGSFNAPGVGTYHLVFDNTYSYMTKKVVRYKAGAIPTVETEEQIAVEEALAHPKGLDAPAKGEEAPAADADAAPASS